MIAAVWVVTLALVLAWSVLSWVVHALLTSSQPWVEPWVQALARWPLADWWLRDVPGWQEHLVAAVEWSRWVFGWIRGVAPWLAWVVWGAGTAALLTTGMLLTLLVVLLRPARPTHQGPRR